MPSCSVGLYIEKYYTRATSVIDGAGGQMSHRPFASVLPRSPSLLPLSLKVFPIQFACQLILFLDTL